MNSTEQPNPNEPHLYVPCSDSSSVRTCEICGFGANTKNHRIAKGTLK